MIELIAVYKDYPVSFLKETGCLTNSVSVEYINRNPSTTCVCVNNVEKIDFQIYIYQIRVMFEYICLLAWPSGGLEIEA